MTILVCDDDKEIVDAIEIYLIQEGYQVVKAYDGEQALDMLRTKKIDLMVIDVMMPKLDGIRATFQARKTSSIPIIDRKSTRLNSSHQPQSRMPSSA